ncbi:hypothetical protein N0V90_005125 [Kalmusia sp. IMI 367209]|nr:hypothetical protein N0V90_005125 [Kalmusia sp. IMI 367209]
MTYTTRDRIFEQEYRISEHLKRLDGHDTRIAGQDNRIVFLERQADEHERRIVEQESRFIEQESWFREQEEYIARQGDLIVELRVKRRKLDCERRFWRNVVYLVVAVGAGVVIDMIRWVLGKELSDGPVLMNAKTNSVRIVTE